MLFFTFSLIFASIVRRHPIGVGGTVTSTSTYCCRVAAYSPLLAAKLTCRLLQRDKPIIMLVLPEQGVPKKYTSV